MKLFTVQHAASTPLINSTLWAGKQRWWNWGQKMKPSHPPGTTPSCPPSPYTSKGWGAIGVWVLEHPQTLLLWDMGHFLFPSSLKMLKKCGAMLDFTGEGAIAWRIRKILGLISSMKWGPVALGISHNCMLPSNSSIFSFSTACLCLKVHKGQRYNCVTSLLVCHKAYWLYFMIIGIFWNHRPPI